MHPLDWAIVAGYIAWLLWDGVKRTRLERTTCAEAMTMAPITCSPATPVARVAALMIEHKIDSMPVLSEDGKLIGLVTSSDLLGLLIDQPEVNRLPFDFQVRVAEPQEFAATA